MRRMRGFTLIELAISLAIIGLVLGMLMVPLNAQVDQRRINDTNKELQLVTEAIMGFAVATGRIPCPATPTDANTMANAGLEAKVGVTCTLTTGVVPWATLGVPETDAWTRRFTYRVSPLFADDATGGLQSSFMLTDPPPADPGNIDITGTGGAPVIADNMAAVIVSHGKNGAGAFQTNGIQVAAGIGDEAENSDGDAIFVSKVHDTAYDDLVAWVSPAILKSRMVAANRLP